MLLRFHCNAVLPKMKENLLNFFRIFSRQSPHVVSNSGPMVNFGHDCVPHGEAESRHSSSRLDDLQTEFYSLWFPNGLDSVTELDDGGRHPHPARNCDRRFGADKKNGWLLYGLSWLLPSHLSQPLIAILYCIVTSICSPRNAMIAEWMRVGRTAWMDSYPTIQATQRVITN